MNEVRCCLNVQAKNGKKEKARVEIFFLIHFLFPSRSGFRTDEQNGGNVKSCVHLEPFPQGMAWSTRGYTRSRFPLAVRTQ